jgi:cytidylate kinase
LISEASPSHLVIAIDGPAASGKSSVARRLAQRLGLIYVNTGAMYRAVTWQVVARGVPANDHEAVLALLGKTEIRCGVAVGESTIFLDGVDPTPNLVAPEVNSSVSHVAAIPQVRERLVALQREYALEHDVVMEGRDIGTVVFPDARVKIFLDADAAERVRRRAGEQPDVPPASLAAQIAERDERDRRRLESPLMQAPDAIYLDSTGRSAAEVEEDILRIVRARISNGKEY